MQSELSTFQNFVPIPNDEENHDEDPKENDEDENETEDIAVAMWARIRAACDETKKKQVHSRGSRTVFFLSFIETVIALLDVAL